MECNYDENLNRNKFLICLQNEFEDIFRKAVFENWIICVPCSESLDNYELSQYNILTHLLIPTDELPETHFRTINDQEVRICDKLIRLINVSHSVPVLFKETFYVDNLRYEVLCIEQPINFNIENNRLNLRIYSVNNLRDCIDLLLMEGTNGLLLIEKLEEIIKQFLFLSSKDYFSKPLDQQINFVKNIYQRCLQIISEDQKISSKIKLNRTFLRNVKISVESYVLHNMYSIIMKGIVTNMTPEIEIFNKILRNLTNIQLKDLDVTDSVFDCIPKARNELSRLNSCNTILGKLNCLKKCINLISKNNPKKNDKLSVDELLPIFVFLIVKSGIYTWVAQLKYVKEFNFSQMDSNSGNEWCFLITTLEAALTFIESGLFYNTINLSSSDINLFKTLNEKQCNRNVCSHICNKSRIFWKTKNPFLLKMFQSVHNGDLDGVSTILEKYKRTATVDVSMESQYCHPLCSCDRCEKLHTNNTQQSLTIQSVNDTGCSPLHVAACYGQSSVLDWLLNQGANPNCSDYFGSTPLHCAAAHGHQNDVLLLMYAGAKLDQEDDDGNQPLYFASVNGHVDCVKALLYFAEHAGIRLDVNRMNKDGDTPLHLAVKYYQKDISEILLMYNANPSLKNKHGNNAFELTESLSILAVLNENYCSVVNLLCALPKTPLSIETNELIFNDNASLLPKEEYGIRPKTAEFVKNTDKLLSATKENDLKSMKKFLGFSEVSESARDNMNSKYSCHPLCRCEKCLVEIIPNEEEKYDFDKMNALSANICNSDGFTALHVACKYGRVEILQFLLDIGVKVNIRTHKQLLTPLHIACMWNQLNSAKILLECSSCKINLVDRNGNTPLHYACIAGNARIVELLTKYEPNVDIRNLKGKTALHEAEGNLSFSIIRLLKTAKCNSKDL